MNLGDFAVDDGDLSLLKDQDFGTSFLESAFNKTGLQDGFEFGVTDFWFGGQVEATQCKDQERKESDSHHIVGIQLLKREGAVSAGSKIKRWVLIKGELKSNS